MLTIRELTDGTFAIKLEFCKDTMSVWFSGVFDRVADISGNEIVKDHGVNICVNLSGENVRNDSE